MIQKLKQSNAGFTLVELIVVIAILGVLAAVLVPQYIQYVEKSKAATDMNTAATIEQAVNVLCADGTITTAGTFVWDTAAGGLTTTGFASNTPAITAASVTNITGAVGAAKSNVAKNAATLVYQVSFSGSVPSVKVFNTAADATDGTPLYAYSTTWKV